MSRTGILVVTLAAALLGGFAVPHAVRPALAEQDPDPEDLVAEARRLADEAARYYRDAGDTDASTSDRRKARKECYVRLKKARRYLDQWLDAHPEDTENLDALYVRISSMLYWVKKEASVGEFDDRPPPRPRPDPKPDPKPDPEPDPEPGASAGAGEGGKPGTEPEPEPEPTGPQPADVLGEIESYERRHPGDVPGLYERYAGFLEQFADPSLPEYERAAERVSVLGEKLKDVYRMLRDDDPDAMENADDAQIERLVGQLEPDLAAEDPVVRTRAARFLGSLGSGRAADPLIEALETESDAAVVEAITQALAKIGGKRVCRKLARIPSKLALGEQVCGIYAQMLEHGGVNARIAGEYYAEYLSQMPEEMQISGVEALHEAGKPGALGLAKALPYAIESDLLRHIEHLGAMGDPRATEYLTPYLRVGSTGERKKWLMAARKAILGFGRESVPYLFPSLDHDERLLWTKGLLFELTGVRQKNDKRKTWERWWRKNRRSFLKGE